jgi:Ca2+-binding EF-hand superfamily protein
MLSQFRNCGISSTICEALINSGQVDAERISEIILWTPQAIADFLKVSVAEVLPERFASKVQPLLNQRNVINGIKTLSRRAEAFPVIGPFAKVMTECVDILDSFKCSRQAAVEFKKRLNHYAWILSDEEYGLIKVQQKCGELRVKDFVSTLTDIINGANNYLTQFTHLGFFSAILYGDDPKNKFKGVDSEFNSVMNDMTHVLSLASFNIATKQYDALTNISARLDTLGGFNSLNTNPEALRAMAESIGSTVADLQQEVLVRIGQDVSRIARQQDEGPHNFIMQEGLKKFWRVNFRYAALEQSIDLLLQTIEADLKLSRAFSDYDSNSLNLLMTELRPVFERADLDHNGKISVHELNMLARPVESHLPLRDALEALVYVGECEDGSSGGRRAFRRSRTGSSVTSARLLVPPLATPLHGMHWGEGVKSELLRAVGAEENGSNRVKGGWVNVCGEQRVGKTCRMLAVCRMLHPHSDAIWIDLKGTGNVFITALIRLIIMCCR